MNVKLIARTTDSINFINNTFGPKVENILPAGTLVEINQDEMEANPNFFHISLLGTDARIWTYVSIEQITPA